MTTTTVPIFPLGLVLFPGGVLPLRIFEPRYLTMIGECMKNGSPFGVVLSTRDGKSTMKESFHSVGTLAQIEDFDQLEDGFLGVTCRGTNSFSILQHRSQDDKLIVADIEMLEGSCAEESLPEEVGAMTEFLRTLCEHTDLEEWAKTLRPEWESTDWLSCRLSELLPLSIESRQSLLEMSGSRRLAELSKVMVENKMI